MVSKSTIRLFRSLHRKKEREEKQLYIIEGDKLIREHLLAGRVPIILVAKPEFIDLLSPAEKAAIGEIEKAGAEELGRVSTLSTPHNAVAVVPFPEISTDFDKILREFCIALDFIQDPGNLGTIIRCAAWFGIKDIVCSENCVDVYNPKVIQATMGAILNVNVHYAGLEKFLGRALEKDLAVYGTFLEGESIYTSDLKKRGPVLIGNEARGISPALENLVSHKLMIPRFTEAVSGVESLNAAMAASIVVSEFTRRRNSDK